MSADEEAGSVSVPVSRGGLTGGPWPLDDPAVRSRVLDGLLAAVGAAKVRRRPFPHAALEGAFPPDVYAEMRRRLPPDQCYVPDPSERYRLPGGTAARSVAHIGSRGLARLPESDREFWAEISSALTSNDLRESVFGLLGRGPVAGHPLPSLVRDRPGYWIEPHPDSPAKLVTVQLYLPGGSDQERLGTSLYRLQPWNLRNLLATGRPLVEFHRFPFLPGRGYAFSVGLVSWHGVEKIPEGAGARDSVLLVYYRKAERAAG